MRNGLLVISGGVLIGVLMGSGPESRPSDENSASKPAPVITPKPLSENVNRGLAWLVKHQHPTGGWGQGEESAHMQSGSSSTNLRDMPNLADTCVATLALMRAGSTPTKGEHAEIVRKALDYMCNEIAESEPAGMYVTKMRGTRVQQKLGPYVDTFLAALVLAEVKDQMPDEVGRKKVLAALDKVMDKIEKNQKSDGTWAKEGWAPVISQSIASKALNKAAQAGVEVSEQVRVKAEDYARGQFDARSRSFKGEGSAGVSLYSASANLSAMAESDRTNAMMEQELRQKAQSAATQAEREAAAGELQRIKDNRADLTGAANAITEKLDDKQFISGFGSNGGEEFLSYMNIGETLVAKGGPDWEKWDKSITNNLNHIQNSDGSWTGHHCITGRTFCTSSALLVLTVDRSVKPLGGEIRRR